MKLEVVPVPVADVDRAKAFYVDRVGFHADHDHRVTDELRFVQLTPPGSACSIVIETKITEMAPDSQKKLQVVVNDVEAVRMVHLLQRPRRQHMVGAADRSPGVVQADGIGPEEVGM